jgi:hypothetical protein
MAAATGRGLWRSGGASRALADIQQGHVVEAIGYRSLDRKLWAR